MPEAPFGAQASLQAGCFRRLARPRWLPQRYCNAKGQACAAHAPTEQWLCATDSAPHKSATSPRWALLSRPWPGKQHPDTATPLRTALLALHRSVATSHQPQLGTFCQTMAGQSQTPQHLSRVSYLPLTCLLPHATSPSWPWKAGLGLQSFVCYAGGSGRRHQHQPDDTSDLGQEAASAEHPQDDTGTGYSGRPGHGAHARSQVRHLGPAGTCFQHEVEPGQVAHACTGHKLSYMASASVYLHLHQQSLGSCWLKASLL